jgi:hypothetical protein
MPINHKLFNATDAPVMAYKEIPEGMMLPERVENLWLITESGIAPTPIIIPASTKEFDFRWIKLSADGTALVGVRYTKKPVSPTEPRKSQYLCMDLKTRQITEIDKKESDALIASQEKPIISAYQVLPQASSLSSGAVSTLIRSIWIGGQQPALKGKALIAADAKLLASTTDHTFYSINDTLYTTQIAKMKRSDLDEEMKRRTISNAKTISIGMQMYAQDYDENFPHLGSDIKEVIQPYIRDVSTFSDPLTGQSIFSANYTATALSSYKTPAETPIARLGRVVIYADGHVKWQ